MRWTDRLTLPQKIVLIIGLGLAFGAFADFLPILAPTTTRFTGVLPQPAYQSTLTLHMPLVSGWLDPIVWLALIAAWALLSIRILRPVPEQSSRD